MLRTFSVTALLALGAWGFSTPAMANHHLCGLPQCVSALIGGASDDQRPTDPPLIFGFGSHEADTSSTGTITFGVTGTQAVTLTSISLGGTDAAEFDYLGGGSCAVGVSMSLHATCTVEVNFAPTSVGAKNATLLISTSSMTRTTNLTGTSTLPAPVITSGLAASGTQGSTFSGYQIIADYSPTSFAASSLPAGLSLNTGTGLISGTPSANGTFNSSISATNATGTGNANLVFTIASGVPSITSAATASGATGTPFSHTVAATNAPTTFTATGLPPGLSINAGSGLISGTPTTGGSYAASVSAANAIGTANQALTITVSAVLPTTTGAVLSVPLNTPASLDLAPLISGPPITGISVVTAPAHGSVSLAGTVATYTPVNNYFGADSFSFVASNNDGDSASASVAVTVTGRPDPIADPVVSGVVTGQRETAKRFTRSQLGNFQQRMERLHRGNRSRSPAPRLTLDAPLQRAAREELERREGLAEQQQAVTPSTSVGSDEYVPRMMAKLLLALKDRSLTLNGSGQGMDGPGWLPHGTEVWVGGTIHFGTRQQTADSSRLRFTTDGLSAGLDFPYSDNMTLGLGVGYGLGETDIGLDGSNNQSRATSLTLYGSYRPTDNTFVDGALGYGRLDYDSVRFVPAVSAFARADFDGEQWFGSLSGGYEYDRQGLLLSPYARLDFSETRLDRTTETGAGAQALTYFDQASSTQRLSLGFRAESQHDTGFGRVAPRMRLEYQHEFESDNDATVVYADQPGGTRYNLSSSGLNRNAVLVGVGSDFLFRNGLKFSIDYDVLNSNGPEESQTIQLWLSKELDGKPLLPSLAFTGMFDDPVRVEAGYTWHDNINRSRDSKDELTEGAYHLRAGKSTLIPVSDHTRVVLSGSLGAEKVHRYRGLDHFDLGARGEYQYRSSGDFDAVTLALFGRLAYQGFHDDSRAGRRAAIGVSARRSVTDQVHVFGALTRNLRDADSSVFDLRDKSARFNLDYSWGGKGVLYLGGEYRKGETVISAPSDPGFLDIADASQPDSAYVPHNFLAYRFPARTRIWTLGLNWPLGPRDSLDISLRRVESKPLTLGTGLFYGTQDPSYIAHQFAIVYLMRF